MSTVLRSLLPFLLTLLGLLPAAFADDHFLVTELAPDLVMLSTDQGSYSNNSLVFTGKDGVLLVDTHHGADREALKAYVDGLGLGAPKYIICTHRHEEHIGGNDLWGPAPVVVAHHRLPEKLRSGTFLFSEYPPESYPDVVVEDAMEITFNGEVIRLADIGGSHDDNEIMVFFTGRKVAHLSSVVNGFNFPSVDSDGDVMEFEPVVRRIMTQLPEDTRIVSGHHGKSTGFQSVGAWDQLEPYAEMMKATVAIVRQGLAEGKSEEQLQVAGAIDTYEQYAGSYVDTDGWIASIVDAFTVSGETRADLGVPLYKSWKKDGAETAVERYRTLLKSREQDFDFNETVLLSIGAKLFSRGLYDDAVAFLLGSIEIYPQSEYRYYTHYLAARAFEKLGRKGEAVSHCRSALESRPEFGSAVRLLDELTADASSAASN